ncbi:MAG: UDP-glucose 4-epimerase GalE [Flavobacteriales bacterium]|nr:UDP-glucose 4-epimerase GalE [Flavobacteriales bacterium]|tara:strand:+ start:6869 stop:7891 length:1023 start_codon:yes stop_codon:yes gene_type:complete
MKILVTGGAGYIGSHTIVELVNAGYQSIVSVDNFINSSAEVYDRIEKVSGQKIEYYNIDLSKRTETTAFFKQHSFDAVIHFAALKSVPESVEQPELYYHNNLNSLLNVMEGMKLSNCNQLIFSSSCSVYGNPDKLPVMEDTPFGEAESPYARSKQMGENIISDFCKSRKNFKALSLRYFNPVGAHPSAQLGEAQSQRPNNLVPIITQTAAGIREKVTVFGDDYNTRDGSCIRDYIHVIDIAKAHVKGVEFLNELSKEDNNYEVINLGSGNGTTVLEMVKAFEEVNQLKLNYEIGPRRAGDVEAIYANNSYAKKKLAWEAKHSLEDMLSSAWKWQKALKNQ